MAETFTPAGCGGRIPRVVAVLLFSGAAVASAALLGGALGWLGSLVSGRWLLVAAVALVAAAALREMGVLRVPVPALRRQVPEQWRRERPLVVWSTGYGAILGVGVGTFLPTATFWAACGGVVALASPASGALCLACFGVGRGIMIVGAGSDPIHRLGGMHRLVRPANVAVLTACAVLLTPGTGLGAVAPPPRPVSGLSDPSVSNGVIAYTEQANGITNVVVLAKDAPPVVFPAARTPSINGRRLAYVDANGIRVLDWRSGVEEYREPGLVDKPSLSGPRLAYVRRVGATRRLIVRNLVNRRPRVVASVGAGVDLGKPSLVGRVIAWHESRGPNGLVFVRSLDTGKTRLIAGGRRSVLNMNPVMTTRHIAWTQRVGERALVLVRPLASGGEVRALAQIFGPRHLTGSMGITPGRVWVTRWDTVTNTGTIPSYTW
jgi:hypothetical protein